jgi:CBS domain-containing protein
MRGAGTDSLPVIDPRGNKLLGLVTARDFERATARAARSAPPPRG